jgi:hypothetical protein
MTECPTVEEGVDLAAAFRTVNAARIQYMDTLGRACIEARRCRDGEFDSHYFEALHADEAMAVETHMTQEYYDVWRHVANTLVGMAAKRDITIRTNAFGMPRVVSVKEAST